MNASVPERTLQRSMIGQAWRVAIRQNSASELMACTDKVRY